MSHPVRDAWIEIILCCLIFMLNRKSHPVRDAWIEIE